MNLHWGLADECERTTAYAEVATRRIATPALPTCAYRKAYSAVSTNVTLLHCAQDLPQYQFASHSPAGLRQGQQEVVARVW